MRTINSQDSEVSDNPQLDGRTYSLKVQNRPMAYTLEGEENINDQYKINKNIFYSLYITILRTQKEVATIIFLRSVVFPFSPLWLMLNKPKLLVPTRSYHTVINIDIPVNRTARQLKWNIRRYTGGGSVTARGRYGWGGSMGLLSKATLQ